MYLAAALLIATASTLRTEKLILDEEFNELDFQRWQHELTLSGGGNWEFEGYVNNRSNSYTEDGVLYLKPTFTADSIGEENVKNGFTWNLWGGAPADYCTQNQFYGCERTSGAGGNYINPITSARIRSVNSFHFRYGRVEFKAKIPKGDWIWPAMWLLPRDNAYGPWPTSGEIDVMESRGNLPGTYTGGGCHQFASTLHWGPSFAYNRYAKTTKTYTVDSGTLADDFHVYGLYWDENQLYTYIDSDQNKVLDVDYSQQSMWKFGEFPESFDNPWRGRANSCPFDREFYIIMNVAVGGTNGYFPDGGSKPWTNNDPHAVNQFWDRKGQWENTWNGDDVALKVDSIKVWQFEDTKEVLVDEEIFLN